MGFQFAVTCQFKVRLDEEGMKQMSLSGFGMPVQMTLTPWDPLHGQQVRLVGGDFPTREEAHEAGGRIQRTIVLAGALGKFAVISNSNHVSTIGPGEMDAFGLQAFAYVGFRQALFEEKLAVAQEFGDLLSERQRIAATLISDGLLMPTAAARLVMFVSAVEALCDQGMVTGADKQALNGIANGDVAATLSLPLAETFRRAVRALRPIGAAEACRVKIKSLLGEDRAKEFTPLYTARSALLHDGTGRDGASQYVDSALNISIDLLRAELNSQHASKENTPCPFSP